MGELHGGVMNNPFVRPEPVNLPPVLKPFRYCEYRTQAMEGGQELCDVFASEVIEGMPFCSGHARYVEAELDKEARAGRHTGDS